MRTIGKDASNPQTRSKYATYAKVDQALRPIYTEHGFSLSFDEDDCPKPDHIRVVCYVGHEAGHTRKYHADMPCTNLGAKGGTTAMNATQAVGSAKSYGKRYLVLDIFNVSTGEHDDDGNGASAPPRRDPPPRPPQRAPQPQPEPEPLPQAADPDVIQTGRLKGTRWSCLRDDQLDKVLNSRAPQELKEGAKREQAKREQAKEQQEDTWSRADEGETH
jgi:hypothetical protein